MFGYVRPEKPDLLVREFSVYKSIYCGLCKAIGQRCGLIPRITVTYDMTFLSLLLLALSPRELEVGEESCILNPLKKKAVMTSNPVLDYAADLSCLLAWYSARDDAADERPLRGRTMALLLTRAARKVARRRPETSAVVREKLDLLYHLEKEDSADATARCFGLLLKAIFLEGLALLRCEADDGVTALLVGDAAEALGRWVYLIDAVDDLERDRRKKNPNPFLAVPGREVVAEAEAMLVEAEEAIDRNLALLTYKQFGGLVYNVVTVGLPATRRRILAGERLPAL